MRVQVTATNLWMDNSPSTTAPRLSAYQLDSASGTQAVVRGQREGFYLRFTFTGRFTGTTITTLAGTVTGARVSISQDGRNYADWIRFSAGTNSVRNSLIGTEAELYSTNDTFVGGPSYDALWGYAGTDTLQGQAGADVLCGGAGNDVLNGGEGIDTALFLGSQSNYQVTRRGSGYRVTSNTTAGEGTDTLTAIEYIQFGRTGRAVAIDTVVRRERADVLGDQLAGKPLSGAAATLPPVTASVASGLLAAAS